MYLTYTLAIMFLQVTFPTLHGYVQKKVRSADV